jgi:hypothetical protein
LLILSNRRHGPDGALSQRHPAAVSTGVNLGQRAGRNLSNLADTMPFFAPASGGGRFPMLTGNFHFINLDSFFSADIFSCGSSRPSFLWHMAISALI